MSALGVATKWMCTLLAHQNKSVDLKIHIYFLKSGCHLDYANIVMKNKKTTLSIKKNKIHPLTVKMKFHHNWVLRKCFNCSFFAP